MVIFTRPGDDKRCCIEGRLHSVEVVVRFAGQNQVTEVHSRRLETIYKSLYGICC